MFPAHSLAPFTTLVFAHPASCAVFGDLLANLAVVWNFVCSVFDDITWVVQISNIDLVRLFHNSVSFDFVANCPVTTLILLANTT